MATGKVLYMHGRAAARVVLSAAVAAAAAAATAAGIMDDPGAKKKVIAMSWGIGHRSVQEVADHAQGFVKAGYDGVAVGLRLHEPPGEDGKLFGWRSPVYGEKPFDREDEMSKTVAALRKLNESGLTDNFVSTTLFFDKWNSYGDDAFWASACRKMALFAKIAREGGCRGILIDTEDYPHVGQFYYIPKFAKFDFGTTAELARRRGRELMQAMMAEYPGMTILSTWLLSNQSRGSYQDMYSGPDAAWRRRGDLFVPIMRGFVEALSPQATLHDGDEAGYYCEASRREFFYDFFAIRSLGMGLMPEDLREKYNRQVRAGFGLYLDSYTLPLNNGWSKGEVDGSRLKHFELNFKQAMEVTDRYVWLWGEHYDAVAWTNTLSASGVYPTWDSALPGVDRFIRFVKDPKGCGESIWREFAASGAPRVNLLAISGEKTEVSGKGGKGTAPRGFAVEFGRERKDGFTPSWEYVAKGHGGRPGARQSGTFGGKVRFQGPTDLKANYGAVYRASVWFKTSQGGKYALDPELVMTKTTIGHPIWNDGGGWMAAGFKTDPGHACTVVAGEPDGDGWREAVVYFRADAFDAAVSISAGVGRRLWEDEWVIVSDPEIVQISPAY